jgi:hypothetical protein
MSLPAEGKLLRIFVGEADHWQGKPLYEAIVIEARQRGLELLQRVGLSARASHRPDSHGQVAGCRTCPSSSKSSIRQKDRGVHARSRGNGG